MTAAQIRVRFRKQRRSWEVDGRVLGAGRRVFKSAEDAHEFARSLLQDTRRGVLPNVDRDVTLAEYTERWLQAVAPDLEAKTLESYTRLLRAHVLPVLGAVRVRDLRRRDVRALLQAKRAGRYSQNTVRLIRAALSSVLSDAEADDLIEVNPALRVGPKRGKREAGQAKKADIRPMSWVQRDAFRKATSVVPRYGDLFDEMLLAGLRPGEALALQPGDLDFQAETIRVERALSGQVIKDTKTHTARTVDMNAELVRVLRQHVAWLSADALRRGWGEPAWLFPSEANTPLDYANVAKAFKRLLKRAGLPAFRPYDCRHTYASLLLSANAPLLYVAQQMGHSSPATTLRFYAKWVTTGDRRWVDLLTPGALEPEETMAGGLEPEWSCAGGTPCLMKMG